MVFNNGAFTNNSTGIIRAENITNSSNFYNHGMAYTGFNGGVGLINTGIFENYGTLATHTGTLNISGSLRNEGTVLVGRHYDGSIGGGTLLFSGASSYTATA